MVEQRVLAVIPARWASRRFPGKVLAPLAGRPVLLHVIEAVRAVPSIDALLVATDHPEVASVARAAGVEAALTRDDHPSGSDRIGEAVAGRAADLILNVQGDEPLLGPRPLATLVELMAADSRAGAGTLACEATADELDSLHVVKVVTTGDGRALYFSRAAIPAVHPARPRHLPVLRHLGVYAYRRAVLERFLAAPPTALEEQEGLEQLRLLELDVRVAVGRVPAPGPGVDTPADLQRCERILASGGAPM